ncbi:hypothetical protein [Xenorhabdus cabanillasii]|uniref:Ribbon-helix-helix protein CopG domain-containing protein n=2 Tax=Xenorhabdus cabanillasii TaxID=351673 RepID=W1J9C1_9GAMM|nr:hypothetical protein [Xenorhabdus cabanillasii]PHM75384.1 hypothetical protein Xcab_04130 [Xenorhabdus cabanillasii JM26]CDL86441.1 conserved hypothetical protein [Xenorhabdus cabanillasii JM26]
MSHDKHVQQSRTPRGVASDKQVVMRLSLEDHEELKALAIKESRSISSLARIYYLAGKKSSQVQVE